VPATHDRQGQGTGAADDRDLARLQDLLQELTHKPGLCPLLLQRLEAARFYKTGAMQEEYLFTLKLARDVLPEVQDPELRSRIDEFLRTHESEKGYTAAR
jgi:hypothetical protein